MKIIKYIYISFFIACFISPTYYSQVHYDYLINTDGKIISAVFDDNRQNLFVATENFVIQQWDFKNAKLVQTLTGPQDIIFSMAIDSEGKFLACGGREQKYLFGILKVEV